MTTKKSKFYELLWQCIQSDQVSYTQIVEHLKDLNFKKWLQDRGFLKKTDVV